MTVTEHARAIDLEALIGKLEQATGPDRGLDAEIACAVKFKDLRPARPDDFDGKYGFSPGNIKCETGFLMSDSYTASLDSALTLVKDDWFVTASRHSDGWYVAVAPHSTCPQSERFLGSQKPAAIAVCIAALKARTSMESNHADL